MISWLFACTQEKKSNPNDWPVNLGDKASSQFSALNQINTGNVTQLQPAWTFSSGDASPDNRSQIQCNPIIIDGVMYASSPKLKVFALDAVTGEQKWIFDPSYDGPGWLNNNRGVTYWEDGDDQRILFTAGPNLIALDAKTGKPVPSFGENGMASLKAGLDIESEEIYVVSTSPGVIYQDLLILGSRVSENSDAAPGHVRAFNVKTGEVAWTFHTIPQPGEFGYETWPEDAWQKIGGANSWAGMTLDEERGMVFVPTGSASFDFWGGNRLGENLFANCLLALNAATGERIWHFQTVHHDLWDRDLPCPPNLVTIEKDGKKIDAVSQATKSGLLFVFDRETGEPIFPIEERAVQSSDLKGEKAWATQPFPTKPAPFARQKFTEEDINTLFPQYVDSIKGVLANTRTGEQFIPPSMQGSMIFPGFDGGAEWGGQAFDASSGMLYVNANEMPWILTMVEIEEQEMSSGLLADAGKTVYQMNCSACHGQDLQGDVTGTYPALTGLSERLEKPQVMQIVNNGKGFMPGFPQIDAKEKEALMAFLYNENTKLDLEDAHEFGKESNEGKVPYTHTGYNRFVLPEGYPAVKPPWGTLSAIDLNKGEIAWQVPLGEFEELTAQGIPQTGTENYGGPIVTSGGLIFIAASKDEYFRAFDKATGKELWKYKLPAGGYATPSTYMVDGKQYVVIACGGGKMGTKSGDSYVAFALPD